MKPTARLLSSALPLGAACLLLGGLLAAPSSPAAPTGTRSGQATRAAAPASVNRPAPPRGGEHRGGDRGGDRDVNRNVNRDINRDVNVNHNVNVDVDNHHHGDWDDDWDHPFATAAAVTAGVALTSAVIGSIVNTVPAGCMTTIVNGIAYQQCGSTWYQPQYAGTTVQYIVVNPPQ